MEKEEYTTFPIGPLSYTRTVQALKEALGSDAVPLLEQDRSYWQWENFLKFGVDSYWIGRVVDNTLTERLANAGDYWKQVGYTDAVPNLFDGTVTLPSDLSRVAAYFKNAMRYPHITACVRLPDLKFVGNETVMHWYFGLENGAALYNGCFCFDQVTGGFFGDDNTLRALVGQITYNRDVSIDIKKPTDYQTAYHIYRIICSKNLVQFRVDGAPALFVVPCGIDDTYPFKTNTNPYSIALVPSVPSRITPFWEVYTDRTALATGDLVVPFSPYRLRVSEGEEVTPLYLRLYQANTNTPLAGLTVAAGSAISHEFPLFGFEKKTLFLYVTQISNVVIDVVTRTGAYREYDSFTLAANTFKSYIMEGSPVLGRVVITPSAYPATIQEAEVSLS